MKSSLIKFQLWKRFDEYFLDDWGNWDRADVLRDMLQVVAERFEQLAASVHYHRNLGRKE